MSRLYINEPSAKVGIKNGRITVLYSDGMEKSLPFESVDGICVFGPVSITAQCVVECLKNDVDIQYYSTGGSYFGRLVSSRHVNTARQRKQAFYDQNAGFWVRGRLSPHPGTRASKPA